MEFKGLLQISEHIVCVSLKVIPLILFLTKLSAQTVRLLLIFAACCDTLYLYLL